MRELHLAKSAGFCYGVRRAVELAYLRGEALTEMQRAHVL